MRIALVTTTLLSLGALTPQPALAADPRVVFDSITGSEIGQIPQLSTVQDSFAYEICDPTNDPADDPGMICAVVTVYVPRDGLGVLLRADATMTIHRVETSFAPSELPVESGPGFFAITDVATREQIWSTRADWQDGWAQANTEMPVPLRRGREYVLSYAAVSRLGPLEGDSEFWSEYGSVEQPTTDLLVAKGWVRTTLDGAASRDARNAVWTFDTATMATGPIPSFSVTAIIGDTDEDGFTDDVDNCIDVANRTQADFDHDRVGDACDNCPYTYNPQQGSCGGGAGTGGNPNEGAGEPVLESPTTSSGCSAGSTNVSLIVMLAAFLLRKRRRSA